MATVVERTEIRREKGWLYFIDKVGDVSRARMARGSGQGQRGRQKVTKVGIEREEGFLYFIDKQGNIAKVKMKRAAKRRTASRAGPTSRPRTAARRKPAAGKTAAKKKPAARKTAAKKSAGRGTVKRTTRRTASRGR